ncbi:MAG: type IX secretion system membrane protein PorP/SprF [Bacteroidetes bacterium]|nr:type IX secretion system membrane protein PorP/SprF [Bacteroidota bacterium]
MKKIVLVLSLSVLMLPAFAQQDPQFTHFFFNNQTFNPGATGINDKICFGLTARDQWKGFAGNPQTLAFNASAPFARQNGIGITAVADQLGASNDVNVKVSYSFHVPLGNGRKLGIGFDGGIINKGINFASMNPVTQGDPYATSSVNSSMAPDIGVGLFYKGQNLYFGASSQKLIASKVSFGATAQTQLRRHYYITGGYNYPVGTDWAIKPSFLVKSDGTATQFDINTLVEWKSTMYLGATYRYQDAAAALVGYKLNGLVIGYSYDFTTNGLREPSKGASQGSHEIYLGFCIKPPVPPKPPKYIDVTLL